MAVIYPDDWEIWRPMKSGIESTEFQMDFTTIERWKKDNGLKPNIWKCNFVNNLSHLARKTYILHGDPLPIVS